MGLCMYVVFIALTMLNIAVTTALPYIIYALIGLMLLVVLIIIPAVTGKTIAQIINRRRLNTIIQAEGSQEKNV